MKDEALSQALRPALLVLRITLGLFLLQWGIEKFIVPQNTVAIWSYFYGLNIPQALSYLFGAVEIAIADCLFLGALRTVAYGAALALHAVSVLVAWRHFLDSWGTPRTTCSSPAFRCWALSLHSSCCGIGITACSIGNRKPAHRHTGCRF